MAAFKTLMAYAILSCTQVEDSIEYTYAKCAMYYETIATLEMSSLECGTKLSRNYTAHHAGKHLVLSYLKLLKLCKLT